MVSSETPRLGPSVVGVSATAERTPGVARASASAAAGRPGPVLVMASSPDRPACRCWVTAWSMVVALNSRVQLMATVSTSGVLADEKRRVAVRRFADARKPPTGESARERRPQHPGGDAGHDRSQEADRHHEEERGHLRCRRGRVRGAGGGRDGEQRHRAGERQQPADHAPRAEQPRLDRGVGQRAGRRHARGAPSGGEDGEQRRRDSAADGRRDRQPVGVDGEVRRGDAVAHERVPRAPGRARPRARSPPPSRPGRRSPPPTRSCGESDRASRPPLAAARSRARAAGSTGPSCWPRRTSR